MAGGSGRFEVVSPFEPTGDQPAAIEQITRELASGRPAACLLGATGTGKTFTMAHVIARLQRPTLIISHNKTLAAQLYEELREFLPGSSVHYFVSYYDYYQPEAYIPQRDIYIEKDASRNDELDQLRLAATSSILSPRDTVVVASVSCIFGLGSPRAYGERVLTLTKGSPIDRRAMLLSMSAMQYQRAEIEFRRGTFRVRGDAVEVWPASEKFAVRVEFFGSEIDRLELVNPASGEVLAQEKQVFLFPAVHHVMPEDQLAAALAGIRAELDEQVLRLRSQGKLLEAQRLLARTKYDLELLEEVGVCPGIENYSRYLDGRQPGERPYCLLDYFHHAPGASAARGTGVPPELPAPSQPLRVERTGEVVEHRRDAGVTSSEGRDADATSPGEHDARAAISHRPSSRDWLLIIDESHVTLPQVRAMHHGDRSRKEVLVEHGFRLPSALDNRPLTFEEFEAVIPQVLFVSATPGPYELAKVGGVVAEQVIRPTGLVDPRVEVRPARGQVPDLVARCRARASAGERVLVTALTKRLCEDLTRYLDEQKLRVRYLHSEIETLERLRILTELRRGEFDVLVGVNLLREGLDLPEVSLVAILDADKEGFLRSPTSLIQLMGRAARHVNAHVVMYADTVTPAMQSAMDETERRRARQLAYNAEHGITPRSIVKAIREGLDLELRARRTAREAIGESEETFEVDELARMLQEEMVASAEKLDFERAASLRDQIKALRGRFGGGAPGASGRVRRSEVEAAVTDRSRGPGSPGSRPNAKRGRRRG